MMVLISHNGRRHIARCNAEPTRFGNLVTPRCYCNLRDTSNAIAADNDRFNAAYTEAAFLRMLDYLQPYAHRLKFVSVPDVVCDHAATRHEFDAWYPRLRQWGYPLAFVGQNGLRLDEVPWEQIATVFIGGDDEWKDGRQAVDLINEAKKRGKWVHVGRCNTARRFRHFGSLLVDSIDGTGFSRFQESQIDVFPRHTRNLQYLLTGLEETHRTEA